ncbi:MAG TPA: hypothetical protein P5525_10160, partial [Candidatus Paceibacterota bacterium]|nr:hypothetical protein [Candidatus Paceibacterota bacterium]
MKPILYHPIARLNSGPGPAIATILLLLLSALTLRADTPYTGAGWIIGAPLPGTWCTNLLGQVGMRGNAHLVQVQCSDARMTGRRTVFVNGGAQADGSALLYGAAYQEVGTWDASGTNFTATGGMWETSYRGAMGADGSLELHIVGYGWGGSIDGLRVEETLTRAAGPIMDPSIPYGYTGTIKPPPLSTNLVIDDFTGPAASGSCYPGWICYGPDTHTYARTDGQLVVSGHWPGVITRNVPDTYTFGGEYTWTVADGQTLEARVDLVNLGANATAARMVLATASASGFYSAFKGHDFVALGKWSDNLPWGPVIMFFYEKAQVPDANVTLSMALTKSKANVIITTRLLDKAHPDVVLYERSFEDTPNPDPALTSAELQSLSGMNLTLATDYAEAPFT